MRSLLPMVSGEKPSADGVRGGELQFVFQGTGHLGGGASLLAAGGAMATAAHLRRKKAADAESGEAVVDEPSGD
jgi:hypothetical protein